jgi:tape measure domain-containing protein
MQESVSFTVFLNNLASKPLAAFGNEANTVFKKVDSAIEQTDSKAGKLGNAFTGLSGLVGGLGLGLAAFSTVKSIGGLAIEAEQTAIAFETMLGSAEKGQKALSNLKSFAAETPFEQDEVIKSGKSLLAFGFAVDELKPRLTDIGNVASGLNIPFTELAEIFGKAKVQGTIFSDDLNQLAGRGVPIFTELAKVMGKPAGEIKKLAADGKIGFAQIQQAFNNMSGPGGQFFELMDKQSQTVGGRWSTLKDGASALGLEIGNGLLPMMSLAVDRLTGLVGVATKAYHWIGENRTIFEALGVAIGFGATAWGLYTLSVNAGSIATSVFTAGQWLLNAALTANPVGIVVVALSALVGGLYLAWQKSEAFRGSVLGLWNAGKTVFRNLADSAIQYLGGLGDILGGVFNFDPEQIKKGLGNTLGGLKSFYTGAGEGVSESFNAGFAKGISPEMIMPVAPGPNSTGALGAGVASAKAGAANTNSIKAGIANVQGDAKQAKNLTVSIDKMIEGGFHVTTNNMKEGARDIQKMIEEVLIRAVHDTELLGG